MYSIYLCSLRNKTMRFETEWATWRSNDSTSLTFQMVLVVPYTLSILRPVSKGTWRKHSTQLRLSCSTATLSGREGKRASEKRRCKESLHVIAWEMLRLWEKVGNQVMFGTPLVSRSFGWQSMRNERRSAEEQSAYWMAAIHYKENTLTGKYSKSLGR